MGLWKRHVEDKWVQYIEDIVMWENQGTKKKRNRSNSEDEDLDPPMPNLPGEAAEMVFEGDDGYQPDSPWKYAADYDQAINDALMDDDLIGGWGENARESSTVANLGVSICNNRVSLGSNLSDDDDCSDKEGNAMV